MVRCVLCCLAMLCVTVQFAVSVQAAEPFDLPDCTADFSSEVVLNTSALEAMIPLAEPGGARIDRNHEMFFIVANYYLERVRGLLLITRGDPAQPPLLLTMACAPYPDALVHIRAFFTDLTLARKQALIAYRDMVWPRAHRASVRMGSMAQIPAEDALEAFAIEVHEVTNAQYRQFIDAGGYTTQALWPEASWAWLQARKRQQPSYWDNPQFNAPEQPVVGVGWYEADAYCRWAGKALPDERQWEKACRGEDGRAFPWGNESPLPSDANLDFVNGGCVDVAAFPSGDSATGCRQMIGNVWEWTSSDFLPYPGFAPDPYKDYSEPWFGTRKVLRGGCWVTRGRMLRNTWRNFYTPDRQDVFAGFRTCATL